MITHANSAYPRHNELYVTLDRLYQSVLHLATLQCMRPPLIFWDRLQAILLLLAVEQPSMLRGAGNMPWIAPLTRPRLPLLGFVIAFTIICIVPYSTLHLPTF